MKLSTVAQMIAFCTLFHSSAPCLRAQAAPETKSDKLVSLMVGRWIGTTSYHRDQDLKTGIPKEESPVQTRATWVTIVPGKKIGSIVLEIAWDDIAKISKDEITIVFDLAHQRLTYKYKDDDSSNSFEQLEGVDDVLSKRGGQITAIEHYPHSEQQRRITISLSRNLWMRELEIRDNSNQPWVEEQRILLTRDQPSTK